MQTLKNKFIYFVIISLITIIILPSYSYGRNAAKAQPIVSSPSAILVNISNNEVLFEKNAYERMYPASTTKILTAILVLESRCFSCRYSYSKRKCC